ncbi:MAG: hypothetical protein ACEQSA_01355 [Weeksellaceae bacterium]
MSERIQYAELLTPLLTPVADIFDVESLINNDFDGVVQNLPAGWKLAKAAQGRAILTNPDLLVPELGIKGLALKVFPFETHARALVQAYKDIKPFVKPDEFPLLYPTGYVRNAVVFPFVHGIVSASEDTTGLDQMWKILEDAGIDPFETALDLAGKLSRFELDDGTHVFTDPFEDTLMSLSDAADKYGFTQ